MRYGKGGKRKTSIWWFVFSLLGYVLIGLFVSLLYLNNRAPETYLAVTAVVMLYVILLTASNIFLAFGTGFLSPNEADILAPFPITSQTFYFSRLLLLFVYTLIPASGLGLGPAVLGGIVHGNAFVASIFGTLIGTITAGITSAMAVITLYSVLIKFVPRKRLMRLFSYTQFAGSFLITGSFVLLPQMIDRAHLDKYTLAAHPNFVLLPPYWFAAITSLLSGIGNVHQLPLALTAVGSFVLFGAISQVLLSRTYRNAIDAIAASSVAQTKSAVTKQTERGKTTASLSFLRAYESRAILRLFRAQFRFDSKFRLSVFAWFPVTALYFILAISQGSLRDPFTAGPKELFHANFLYLVAMLSPMLVMQQIAQSESYKASWIFFASPIDRGKLVIGVRNLILLFIFLPYVILLTIAFALYMPVPSAVMHMLMLSAIAQLIFQFQMWLSPKLPFSEQRKQQKNSASRFFWVFLAMILPLALLYAIIYYCYPHPALYWATLALIITIALLFDRFVQSRLRKKLELLEYTG